MSPAFFPDNSVVVNFAHANELTLLRTYLRSAGRVTEAVSYEIATSAGSVPHLHTLNQDDWFGDAIEFTDDVDRRAIEGIRIGIFNGSRAKSLQHLGESQTLHLIRTDTRYSDATWITEDRDAYDYARTQHIRARHTVDVLTELVTEYEITADQAYAICCHIIDADRPLMHPPTSARDFQ